MTPLSIRHAAAGCAVVAVGALGGVIAGCGSDDVQNAQDKVDSVKSQAEKAKTDAQNQLDEIKSTVEDKSGGY